MCCLWTCVSSMAACAALERVSSLCFPWTCPCISATAVCNILGVVWHAAACFCFRCAYLFNSSQCCAKRSMAYSSLCSICTVCSRACAAPGCVCLHGLLCYTCVSVYKSFVLHTDVSRYKVLHLDVSAYKSFVLHLDVPVCKNFCCTCACLSTRALWRTWTCLPTRVQPRL